jgi:hypothetical protein
LHADNFDYPKLRFLKGIGLKKLELLKSVNEYAVRKVRLPCGEQQNVNSNILPPDLNFCSFCLIKTNPKIKALSSS